MGKPPEKTCVEQYQRICSLTILSCSPPRGNNADCTTCHVPAAQGVSLRWPLHDTYERKGISLNRRPTTRCGFRHYPDTLGMDRPDAVPAGTPVVPETARGPRRTGVGDERGEPLPMHHRSAFSTAGPRPGADLAITQIYREWNYPNAAPVGICVDLNLPCDHATWEKGE